MMQTCQRLLQYLLIGSLLLPGLALGHGVHHDQTSTRDNETQPATAETAFLTSPRQITHVGARAGEGYFSRDGQWMIFQSEREADNPFYQIYLMDMKSGSTHRVSPGIGKTTCAWIHPQKTQVLFASTHLDPDAVKKQQEEIERRLSGQQQGYVWDFDEYYDIFVANPDGSGLINVTNTRGYDAEGDWSPDGSKIVFASNRRAYTESLSEEEQAIIAKDPSYMMDIYIMDADGSNVQQLTDTRGYDGGPFFSDDGQSITWRRFTPDGRTAEIWTMRIDGSEQKQLTKLNAMSWAPYFHPSGDYLIFGTNVHGHRNFELYVVDAAGQREPLRISYTDGFDGLPVFTPDGNQLAWTSTRGVGTGGQIFLADWNDHAVRLALGLPPRAPQPEKFSAQISADDLRKHITYLASDALGGRMTGTEGERLAREYVSRSFASMGLLPEAKDGSYFEPFTFTAGVNLGSQNALSVSASGQAAPELLALNQQWRPLAFSQVGPFQTDQIVFAGYGLVVPESGEFPAYDSYKGIDIKDKWVLVFRFVPEGVDAKFRQHLNRHAALRRKAMLARERGARGILVVSGPNARVNEELVPLRYDASLSGAGVVAISLSDTAAEGLVSSVERKLKDLQDTLDSGEHIAPFPLDRTLAGTVDIEHEQRTGYNILARLQVGAEASRDAVMIGAHYDHLGERSEEEAGADHEATQIFNGADDNASGTAGVLEIAHWLASAKAQGKLSAKRDVLFALWSGEELGLLGSSHYVKTRSNPHESFQKNIAAYLNMDMIGRLDESLVMQAVGSSKAWLPLIEHYNATTALPIITQIDPYLPTDSTSFYLAGVPTLNAFTGAHDDYHTPRDTADKINYPGTEKVSTLFGLILQHLAMADGVPDFVQVEQPGQGGSSEIRVYLGTIPDYSNTSVEGVLLSGVKPDSPAAKTGLQTGDIIVSLGGTQIANIYDYTFVLTGLRPLETYDIEIQRGETRMKLRITPESRT